MPHVTSPSADESVRVAQAQLALMCYEVTPTGQVSSDDLKAFHFAMRNYNHSDIDVSKGITSPNVQKAIDAETKRYVGDGSNNDDIRAKMERLKAKVDNGTSTRDDVREMQNILIALGGKTELSHLSQRWYMGKGNGAYKDVMDKGGVLDRLKGIHADNFVQLHSQLEQSAAYLAEHDGGILGKKISNEYLAKIQQSDLTPAKLTLATQQFVTNYPSQATLPSDPSDQRDMKSVLYNMQYATDTFVSKYHIPLTRESAPTPTVSSAPMNTTVAPKAPRN